MTTVCNKKRGESPGFVIRDLLLVFHPSPRLRVTSPTPRRSYDRHPPPGFHPRKLCLRGTRGRWAFIRPMRRIIVILSILWRWGLDHPAPTTHENCIFAGPGIGHPSAEGNFVPRRYGLSSPPLEGWRLADGVVRECVISHLVP